MKRLFLGAVLAALVYVLPGEASAAVSCPPNFQGQQSQTCFCSPSQMVGTVWGSGPYTTDSSVCAAALHAGAVARSGGTVSVQVTAGCTTYGASGQNGVNTAAYGPWSASFYFPKVGSANCQGVRPAAPAAPAAAAGPCPSSFHGIQSATCSCAPSQMVGTVWGSGPYTTDSSICAAALHAGAVAKTGGIVSAQATSGCSAYGGSRNNGVSTTAFGPWSSSFYFPGVGTPNCSGVAALPAAPPPPVVVACPSSFHGRHGVLTCQCTPAQFAGQVWGTGTYAEDSSVCGAALHAGAVARTGGIVTVEHMQGCGIYKGSFNNGITTANYGTWSSSFYFPSVGGGVCAVPPPGRGRRVVH